MIYLNALIKTAETRDGVHQGSDKAGSTRYIQSKGNYFSMTRQVLWMPSLVASAEIHRLNPVDSTPISGHFTYRMP